MLPPGLVGALSGLFRGLGLAARLMHGGISCYHFVVTGRHGKVTKFHPATVPHVVIRRIEAWEGPCFCLCVRREFVCVVSAVAGPPVVDFGDSPSEPGGGLFGLEVELQTSGLEAPRDV